MDHATLVYSRSWALPAQLIRHAERFGRWSHCGVVLYPDDDSAGRDLPVVVEARFPQGVVPTALQSFAKRASTVEYVRLPVPDLAAGVAWLKGQIGKPYDWRAIAGNLLRVSWHDDDAWQCAELVEAFLAACGQRRFRTHAWRISPSMSWAVV